MKRFSCLVAVWVWIAACGEGSRATVQAAASHALPQRIVSQTVVSDEILWALGPQVRARVVGVSKMVDDPRYSAIARTWPSSVARVPGTSEALVAAQPDLVIIADFSAAETRSLLRKADVPTLELHGFDGFDAYRQHATRIAEAVGAAAAGKGVVAQFDTELAALSRVPAPTAPTVVSWAAGNVAGTATTFDDEATAAGLRNVAAAHGIGGHRAVALEQIMVWNPDFVVIDCETDCAAAERRLAERPGWSAMTAAEHGHIIAIDARLLYSTSHAMLEVVRILRRRNEEAR